MGNFMKVMYRQFYIWTFIVFLVFSCQDNTNKINNIQPKQLVDSTNQVDSVKKKCSVPELISYKQSECKTNCELRGRIIQSRIFHDTLLLKVATVLDCGVNYTIEIETSNEGSLNIKPINNTGSNLDCYCLYIFEIRIKNILTIPKKIFINGTPVEDIHKFIIDGIVDPIEEMPTFPGGDEAYKEFFKKNLIYPVTSFKSKTEGTVYVSCIIDEFGKIHKNKILRGINHELDSEACRLISIMPLWTPVKDKNNKNEVSKITLPIKFSLMETNK